MKIQNKNYPYLGLINFEGDCVRAYKTGKGAFTIIDDCHEIIAEWNDFEIWAYVTGRIDVTTSYGKTYNFTKEHKNAKPSPEKLYKFLGIENPDNE